MKIETIAYFSLILIIGLATSCTPITNLFPKEKRAFKVREFDSAAWKNGDYQTRGEMSSSKISEQIYKIKGDVKEEVTKLLGNPESITKAICCYDGRAGKSDKEIEVWLYYIDVEDYPNKKDLSEKPLVPKALKIYFDNNSLHLNIGERSGDHSYFPIIGALTKQ